jgi:CBS domain-containing protein
VKWEYSKQAIGAFFILLFAYFLLVGCLWLLQVNQIINFQTEVKGDILPLMASMPFVALYLLVLIAATAGYARGAIMAKELPFKTILKQELKDKKMSSATIRTKTRSSAKIYEDTPFMWALNDIISARISILPVIDKEKNEVKGVLTSTDFLKKLQEELKILQDENSASGDRAADPAALTDSNYRLIVKNLQKRLEECKVRDINPQSPIVVSSNENLHAVMQKMIEKQFTKLIVVNNDNSFAGTVDALDLIGEIYENDNGN